MSPRPISRVMGFDDGPFAAGHRGDVLVVGAVFAGARLEGIVSGRIRADGANATRVLARLAADSRFGPSLQAVLVQGVALGGFNVVDLPGLHRRIGLPVLAVTRRRPSPEAVRRALLARVPGGRRKWGLIDALGPAEPLAGLFVHRVGIDAAAACGLIRRLSIHGRLPEPLRVAHLVAGGVVLGASRHRA